MEEKQSTKDELNKKEFLNGYKKLCLKYKLYIYACGCCNSPMITTLNKDYDIEHEIRHLEK